MIVRPLLGVLLLASTVAAQTATVDPRSLLGEWAGEVVGPVTARYTLTIDKVDGNNVHGHARAVGPRGTTQYDILGTVQGATLEYHTPDHDLQVELVIEGDRLHGIGHRKSAEATGRFSLTRQKPQ